MAREMAAVAGIVDFGVVLEAGQVSRLCYVTRYPGDAGILRDLQHLRLNMHSPIGSLGKEDVKPFKA